MKPDLEKTRANLSMKCLNCGTEMEHGTVECVGAGFESRYEFTAETERAKKGVAGFLTRKAIAIPSTLAEHPAWHCPRCRKVLMWVDSKG